MSEPWFERLERDQALTGYVQQSHGSGITGPGNRYTPTAVTVNPGIDMDQPVICHCGRWFCRHHDDPEPEPETPGLRGLTTEFASYAWGIAINRIRGTR